MPEHGNELIKNLEKMEKNRGKLKQNTPKTQFFMDFKPQMMKNSKPGYPGFRAKKPNPLKWKKPGF